MAKTKDLIQRILEIRGRSYTRVAFGEYLHRYFSLEPLFNKRKEFEPELLRYFPVALVALMESYFRLVIKEFVDLGEPYLSNASNLFAGNKIDFEILKALHGKQISLGDILSQVASLNNLSLINSNLSILIGKDYLLELRTVYSRRDHEGLGKPKSPILKDPDATYSQVSRTFELRHIICHESATEFEITCEEIEKCYYGTMQFLNASEKFISNTMYPEYPLSQSGMNKEANENLQKTLVELKLIEEKISSKLEEYRIEQFKNANSIWNEFMKKWANFEADFHKGGTQRSGIYSHTANRIAKTHLKELNEYNEYLDRISAYRTKVENKNKNKK